MESHTTEKSSPLCSEEGVLLYSYLTQVSSGLILGKSGSTVTRWEVFKCFTVTSLTEYTVYTTDRATWPDIERETERERPAFSPVQSGLYFLFRSSSSAAL